MSKFIVYWSSRILTMSCFSPPLLGKNIYTGYTEVSKLCNRKLKDNPQVFFSLYWKQGKTSFLFLSGHKLLVIKFCASNKVLLRDILLCPGFHKNIVCGVKSLLYKNNALREYSILFDISWLSGSPHLTENQTLSIRSISIKLRYSLMVSKFWKNPQFFWRYWVMSNILGYFFQILWPSQNI